MTVSTDIDLLSLHIQKQTIESHGRNSVLG
jgi:hypothetical protein